MSTKGKIMSLATRQKISLANTKDRTELLRKLKEYAESLGPADFPSITNAALYSGISENALLAWEARTEDNTEIRQILDFIRDRQKSDLFTKGLNKVYDSKLTGMLLAAHHNVREQPQSLVQNNTFNISPELLAEAIELTRSKK